MQFTRAFLILFLLALAPSCEKARAETAANPADSSVERGRFSHVDIPVCKTSIYVGSVTMKTGRFEQHGERYLSTYEASVFPFFFYREKGTISIRVGAESLSRLARGEKITLDGTATTSSGEIRRIEGTAVPSDIDSGKLKIKVIVSRSIKLTFNSSYRFTGESTTTTSPSFK